MTSKTRPVRSIDLKVTVSGSGTLNFDDASLAKWEDKRLGISDYAGTDNVKMAKKTISREELAAAKASGSPIIPRTKISSTCLRHYLFPESAGLQSSVQFVESEIFVTSVASFFGLLRGWQRSVKNNDNLKRKSPLSVTDAKQVSGDALRREVSTSSGVRSSTSFTNRDVAGDAQYEFKASLDIGELAFLSLDIMFDRQALTSEDYRMFREILKAKTGFELPENPSRYKKASSEMPLAELGILLPDDLVHALAQDLIRRILSLEIRRAEAFGKVEEAQIKFTRVGDPAMNFDGAYVLKAGELDKISDLFSNVTFAKTYEQVSDTKIESFSDAFEAAFAAAQQKNDKARTAETKAKKEKKTKNDAPLADDDLGEV